MSPALNRLKAAAPAILLCSFAAVLVGGVWSSTQRQIDDARERLLQTAARDASSLARLLEEHSVRTIQSADQAVQFLKYEYMEQGRKLDLAQMVRDGVILGDIFNLYSIVGPNGQLVLSDKPFTPMSVSDREHIRVHRERADVGLFVSKPVLGRLSQKWSIQLTRRIDGRNGEFGGVVVVSMDPFYFTRLYESARIGQHSSVALIGDDGIVRARRSGNSSEIGQDVTTSPLFAQMRDSERGIFIRNSIIDGRERVYAYRRLENYPLKVVVGIDTEDVLGSFEPLRRQLLEQAAGMTLTIAGFTLLLLLLIRRLVRSRAQALSASAAKSQFLSNMSHELRTPLNGILGYAELLRDDLPPGEHRTFARYIHESGEHLQSLVNQILQLNKIEAGRERLVLETVEVRAVVARAVNTHRSSALAKRLALDYSVGSAVPVQAQCDRMKLTQVLNNLLHNAIKFTESGWVHLALDVDEGFLRFEVSDTGPGIEPDLQGHVFEKFFQVDAHNARRNDGTGLGLALVRELVELMGGEVGVHSQPGHGTTFVFTIPCIAALAPEHGGEAS